MNKVRFGIIGIGNMGSGQCTKLVARKVRELEPVGAADVKESRRNWAKQNLPETVRIFESGDELIRSGVYTKCDRGFMVSVGFIAIEIQPVHHFVRT